MGFSQNALKYEMQKSNPRVVNEFAKNSELCAPRGSVFYIRDFKYEFKYPDAFLGKDSIISYLIDPNGKVLIDKPIIPVLIGMLDSNSAAVYIDGNVNLDFRDDGHPQIIHLKKGSMVSFISEHGHTVKAHLSLQNIEPLNNYGNNSTEEFGNLRLVYAPICEYSTLINLFGAEHHVALVDLNYNGYFNDGDYVLISNGKDTNYRFESFYGGDSYFKPLKVKLDYAVYEVKIDSLFNHIEFFPSNANVRERISYQHPFPNLLLHEQGGASFYFSDLMIHGRKTLLYCFNWSTMHNSDSISIQNWINSAKQFQYNHPEYNMIVLVKSMPDIDSSVYFKYAGKSLESYLVYDTLDFKIKFDGQFYQIEIKSLYVLDESGIVIANSIDPLE